MKLRSALIVGIFALVLTAGKGCPCGGVISDNGGVPGAETFYCGGVR